MWMTQLQCLAMAALHYCYARGLGTEPDVNLARQWAQRAHDSEHPAGALRGQLMK